jgi:AhpD family alkylhydroperoxidase
MKSNATIEAIEPRINFSEVRQTAQGVFKAMYGLEAYLHQCGLESSLLLLVKTRASQINGCAYCIDMHTREAKADGETDERLFLLDAWREASCFTRRERAALAWTEAVTLIREGHVPAPVYDEARAEFGQEELLNLTLAVVAINGWNRLSIPFRITPGEKFDFAR